MEDQIEYSDFEKLKIIVAEILEVEEIKGADKLYKLTLNTGKEERTICAGIKPYYRKEDLLGKKIVYLSNLKPRTLKGIESQGMLLAAGSKETNTCVLIVPDKDIEVGSRIS